MQRVRDCLDKLFRRLRPTRSVRRPVLALNDRIACWRPTVAFGAKRKCKGVGASVALSSLTHLRHRPDRSPAAQQPPSVAEVCYSFLSEALEHRAVKRREFVRLLGGGAIAFAFSPAASAQGRQARIGLLMPVSPPAAYLAAFREGLRERGYVEGQNLSIDVRWPPGPFEQNPGVVVELVRANVDVIVAWSTPALMAAGRATSTIPIVGVSISDLVGTGFVASLARPGGNVTGVTPINPDLSGKLVELLREIVPAMKHVGVLVNPANPGSAVQMPGVEHAARAMGLQLKIVEARSPEEFARGFARLSEHGAQGVVLLADPSFIEHRALIAELARNARLPTAFQRRENVEAGGLLAYGADNNDQFRQAAFHVDQILKGAKPANLPVQQPVKFELAVNLKTAKMLGLEVPPLLLARADEVIE